MSAESLAAQQTIQKGNDAILILQNVRTHSSTLLYTAERLWRVASRLIAFASLWRKKNSHIRFFWLLQSEMHIRRNNVMSIMQECMVVWSDRSEGRKPRLQMQDFCFALPLNYIITASFKPSTEVFVYPNNRGDKESEISFFFPLSWRCLLFSSTALPCLCLV